LKEGFVKKYPKGALGGTFDRLHTGHKRLIEMALGMCDRLVIGLTSDEFVKRTKSHGCMPFESRANDVLSFVESLGASDRIQLVKIDDFLGPAGGDPEIEALFVTVNTMGNGFKINDQRRISGLPPVEIIVIPLAIAEGGGFISSSRIRASEIDTEGRMLRKEISDS